MRNKHNFYVFDAVVPLMFICAAVLLYFSWINISHISETSVFTVTCDLVGLFCMSLFCIGVPHNAKGNARVASMLTMLILIYLAAASDILCLICQGMPQYGRYINWFHISGFVFNNAGSLFFYIFARKIVRAQKKYGIPFATFSMCAGLAVYILNPSAAFFFTDGNFVFHQTALGALFYLIYPVVVQCCALYIAFKYNIPKNQKLIFVGFNVIPITASILFRTIFGPDILSLGYTVAALICYTVFYAEVDRENSSLQDSFKCYFSDDIVRKLSDEENEDFFAPRYYYASILTVDVRGFTALSQHMIADNLVSMVNHEFSAMAEIIEKNEGVVLEFLGDGLTAVFGAPFPTFYHEDKAVNAAILIQNEMKNINKWNIERGFPVLEVGIGINTRNILIGSFGSSAKTVYKAIGSEVDRAAVIQSFSVNGKVLISKSTLDGIKCGISAIPFLESEEANSQNQIYSVESLDSPFNVCIDRVQDDIIALHCPVPVKFRIFDGKQIRESVESGTVTALNEQMIHICSDADFETVSEIDLSLPGYEYMYAKKEKQLSANEAEFVFSSKPVDFRKWIIGVLVKGNY